MVIGILPVEVALTDDTAIIVRETLLMPLLSPVVTEEQLASTGFCPAEAMRGRSSGVRPKREVIMVFRITEEPITSGFAVVEVITCTRVSIQEP